MSGDYYTIAEAAEFIASKTGKKKNVKDVLLNAKKGKIRLCMWFNGTLYKFNRDKGTNKLQSIDDYKFSGYIQIPCKRITPEGGEIQFGEVTLIEVVDVWASNRDPRTLDDNELSGRYFDSQYNGYLPQNLFCNLDEALIPEQDLDDFVGQYQAERSLTNKDTSAIKITPETESDRTNTKKLRRNSLDPAINKAIENAGNTIPINV
ncbi:hypothetical protein R2103_05535 [Nitrosomonas sp. Is24]|uniref:hypothetical protein n=1 Tax=Nitrosomonas sp. Is24 TaxID=3080533 RepID=UPI00294B00D0|nr:hypothetical protein [Nitrosomonas sp. Is24]MDV6341228.1 hypothetical protein [Nitrosomonas sp. Is24]